MAPTATMSLLLASQLALLLCATISGSAAAASTEGAIGSRKLLQLLPPLPPVPCPLANPLVQLLPLLTNAGTFFNSCTQTLTVEVPCADGSACPASGLCSPGASPGPGQPCRFPGLNAANCCTALTTYLTNSLPCGLSVCAVYNQLGGTFLTALGNGVTASCLNLGSC